MSSPHYPHFGEDFRAPPGVRRGHISLEYSDGSVSSPDSTKHSPSRVAAKLSAGRVFTLYHHATGVREVYGSVAEFTDAVLRLDAFEAKELLDAVLNQRHSVPRAWSNGKISFRSFSDSSTAPAYHGEPLGEPALPLVGTPDNGWRSLDGARGGAGAAAPRRARVRGRAKDSDVRESQMSPPQRSRVGQTGGDPPKGAASGTRKPEEKLPSTIIGRFTHRVQELANTTSHGFGGLEGVAHDDSAVWRRSDSRVVLGDEGVPIRFPFREALAAQQLVMNTCWRAFVASKHVMCESPTGTGKSVALLTAALAFQRYWKSVSDTVSAPTAVLERHRSSFDSGTAPQRIPIVYASRTHSQLVQIKTELATKLSFRPTMTVLGSRSMLCANEDVLLGRNGFEEWNSVNERCSCARASVQRKSRANGGGAGAGAAAVSTSLDADTVSCPHYEALDDLATPRKIAAAVLPRADMWATKKGFGDFGLSTAESLPGGTARGASDPDGFGDGVVNIEDLVEAVGHELNVCPYYTSRVLATHGPELHHHVDLTLVRYQYLFMRTGEKSPVAKSNAIIIIDEAHNVDSVCRDEGSCNITLAQIEESTTALRALKGSVVAGTGPRGAAAFLLEAVSWLVKYIARCPARRTTVGDEGAPCLSTAPIIRGETLVRNFLASEAFVEMWDKVTVLENWAAGLTESDGFRPTKSLLRDTIGVRASRLNALIDLRDTCYLAIDHPASYALYVEKPSQRDPDTDDADPALVSLTVQLLDAGVLFGPLAETSRSVVLASGTLSPVEATVSELGTQFRDRLLGYSAGLRMDDVPGIVQADHAITQRQLKVYAITSMDGAAVDSRFSAAHSPLYAFRDMSWYENVLRGVSKICSVVPNGVLVFAPSFRTLEILESKAGNHWKPFVRQLLQHKHVVFERRDWDAEEFKLQKARYERLCDPSAAGARRDPLKTGAVLFAVYRGKMSEGVSFNDHRARAVICVGYPLPSIKAPVVQTKRYHNNCRRHGDGQRWYVDEAHRAVNQALGRCIRHKNDFGVLVMLDSRLGDSDAVNRLPKWLAHRVKVRDDVQGIEAELQPFFDSLRSSPPGGPGEAAAAAAAAAPAAAPVASAAPAAAPVASDGAGAGAEAVVDV